ncbi:uncharacterized protein LOC131060068 [Cryptomeria japonica]|uniref:uncharacterized protein LOC131060068 n=1 Tax=Cryptomeria japonica TaxID=3369 RepID=UPI0025ACCC47|nr:uncharacterized protein LOC131060068 [Cryptomeria japonica]
MPTTRRHKRNGVVEHKKRMQAAVQAILPLGFSRDLISNTIQNLLQVYGGEEGWAFIEEESYKVVVESIFGKEEPCSPKFIVLEESLEQYKLASELQETELLLSWLSHSLQEMSWAAMGCTFVFINASNGSLRV